MVRAGCSELSFKSFENERILVMKLSTLKKAKPEDVLRLAKWLRLRINGMSYNQILKLIKWRTTRGEHNRH